ncbi:hypothetical protein BDQ17DRAFT_1440704 [Cyathus striatus]|nr:hypothetical protein BDQ17DRAFT_1440704 [Cyathus striatus]
MEHLGCLPADDIPDEITGILQQCKDVGIVDEESDGYIPNAEDEVSENRTDEETSSTGDEPDVIPYTVAGTSDTDTSKLSVSELMEWGVNNLWMDGMEGSYAEQVRKFIAANIHAYAPGLESAESVQQMENDVEIAYSQPLNPDSENYWEELEQFEAKGQPKCKRRAPFEKAETEYIKEDGTWAPKRLYEYTNNWNAAVTTQVKGNNDSKLLTYGRETLNIGEYIFSYAAKGQGSNYNLSALMQEGYAYHMQQEENDSLQDQQKKLLFRLANVVNREQELAAPLVMSYIMGWGDTYKSHYYTPIYWSSFGGAILREFPEIRPFNSSASTIIEQMRTNNGEMERDHENREEDSNSDNEGDNNDEGVSNDEADINNNEEEESETGERGIGNFAE